MKLRRSTQASRISKSIWKVHAVNYVLSLFKPLEKSQVLEGSLTVWVLYAYFSDSQNAAFELLVGACSISAIGESNCKSQLAKYFQIFLRIRELWRVERGGGLKFHEK